MRNLLLYEDEDQQQLIVGAGLKPSWLSEGEGTRVKSFPTQYGMISYSAVERGNRCMFMLSGDVSARGGITVCNSTRRKAVSATLDGLDTTLDEHGRIVVRKLPASVVFKLAEN